MIDVFLSHSSIDKPFVRQLADALETGGQIKAWLDEREIGYGENILAKIEEGLDADFVLLILSPDSVKSKWVNEEWTAAHWDQVESQQVKLAGVLYRDCRIPYLLRNKKYFDLRANQIDGFSLIRTWLLDQRPPSPPVVHLPQRPPLVIGREPEMEELQRRLQVPGSVAYVSGLPGRGKTTLAKEYAHRHQSDFEAVHWLPCEGRSLVQIAGELEWQLGLKLEGDLDSVLRQLIGACSRKHCLLVLDNVEDDGPARLMPAGRTSVLITTRLTNLRFLRGYRPIQLPLFTEEQCFELFRETIGEQEVEKHRADARLLFRSLEYLPIGISVAASLIREDVRYTIAGLAGNLPADAYGLLSKAVAAISPETQTLLASMAVCAQEGFRLTLAAEIAGLSEPSSLDALQEMYARSLVEELDRSTRRYRLHALVREAAAASDSQREKHVECLRVEFEDWENGWRQCETDLADWHAAFSWLLQQTGNDRAWSTAKRMADLGYSLTQRLGRLPEAHEICERMAQEANVRRDARTLQASYGDQASVLNVWGRLEEAMELLKKQEVLCLQLGDEDGLHRSYGNQALILQDWGRLEDAMALHKKEEAICLELGDNHGLQASYGNQALILQDWGRLEEAMDLHKKQEAICLQLGNNDSLQASYGNQALILEDWGRPQEAMALHKQKEAICLELGNKGGLARCYANWGLLARKLGDRPNEKEKLEQALTLFAELKMPREIEAVQNELNHTNRNGEVT